MVFGYVGVLIVWLEMFWVSNFKEKCVLVWFVVEWFKVCFLFMVVWFDGLDVYDWEVIGVVIISNDY